MARLSSLLALILVVGGCAAGAPSSAPSVDPFDPAAAGSDDVLLTIQNNDFRDASVYAIWNGLKTRVGSVTGMTSQTFRMSWRSEEVQLEVDFVSGGGYMSERVPVTQGDHLDFVIMAGAGE
ncbi:MAG: hypothetical protein ABL963_16425 [Longimicrobiales bacterium]